MSKRIKSHLALLIVSIIFGANYHIAKGLMPNYLSPMQIIFLRVSGALVLFWVVSIFSEREKIEGKDFIKIAVCSLFGVAINQTCFFKGLSLTTPVNTSIIHASSPILVVVFASIIIKEKITGNKIIGIILGALGSGLLILYGRKLSFGTDTLRGNIIIFINISAYGLYLVLVKPLMNKYKVITIMKWIFLFGFIFIIPFTYNKISSINFSNFTTYSWSALLYVVIGTTFIAYLLTTYSLETLNATVAGFYMYIQPLVAALIALIINGETINLYKIISAILIFIGVYFVNRENKILEQIPQRQ